MADLATFTKDDDVSNADSTVWMAKEQFSKSNAATVFENSLSDALENEGYVKSSGEFANLQDFALEKDGFSYLVTVKITKSISSTSYTITITKKES